MAEKIYYGYFEIKPTMFNILRQFDMAYAHFKGRLGEMDGISHEEGEALMTEDRPIRNGLLRLYRHDPIRKPLRQFAIVAVLIGSAILIPPDMQGLMVFPIFRLLCIRRR